MVKIHSNQIIIRNLCNKASIEFSQSLQCHAYIILGACSLPHVHATKRLPDLKTNS